MSTPPTTQVPVTLVTCVVPVIAEVGDQLFIFNGVCIGVSTAVKVPPPPPKPKAKAKAKATPKSKRRHNRRASQSEMNTRVAKVKELLAIKPTTGKVLMNKLKLTKGEFAPILNRLNKENALLKPLERKNAPGVYRIYQLASTPLTQEEPAT